MSQLPIDPTTLVERYVAVWNEPQPDVRSTAIRELWADGGAHVLQSPPQEIRDAASRLTFPAPALQIRGHEALESRVTHAYEQFIAPGEFVFRRRGEPSRPLPNVVTFGWEMVPTAGGDPVGAGLEVVVLDGAGRIAEDHQFVQV
jgi:hypothetical protein